MVTRALALALAALVLLAGPARAELIAFFGDERVGNSGGQFLRVPAGARELALGGGMAATSSGASSVFWNPAGLREMGRGQRVFFSHMEYVEGIDVEHFAVARRHGDWHLALAGGVLRSGEITRTTEFHPQGTGQTFRADQFVASFTLGRDLTDRFAFAATGKFLQENLDDYANQGVFLDLGALYYVGYRRARIGFTVRNFGPEMKLDGAPPAEAENPRGWQGFPAPTVAVFGFAYDMPLPLGQVALLSLDFSHPSDEVESVVLAAETELAGALQLRGGWRNQVEDGGISLGFGLRLDKERQAWRLGYGYADRGSFGDLHMISLEWGE